MNIFYRRAFWLNLAGACVVAIVAAVPILMSAVMDSSFALAKRSLAQPLAVLAFGAVLLGGGWNDIVQGKAAKVAAGSLAAFLLLAIISTALSENPEAAIFGGYHRQEGLLAWGSYGALFFAVLGWARRAGRVETFLDVLLLASVIPVAYALQQRLDMDFYFIVNRELTRPDGTLGSPLFLAAYLALLLPITVARCWQARHRMPDLALWVTVAVFQLCGLLVTQTRGPLLAAILGMLMLACCIAGYVRARRAFVLAFAGFTLVAASIVAINALPGARHWAQDVPVIGRMVFNPDRDAGAETQRASRSAASRLPLWEAGVKTFAAAPLERKLLGFGPESAYVQYYPHIPVSLVRILGNEVQRIYDRMHADTLEIGLNFGFVAWLVYCLFFGTVIYAAIRALFGLTGNMPAWIFIAFTCGGGALASIAAGQVGLTSAIVPAFGLGVGAGWLMFMAVCAWRELGRSVPAKPAPFSRWVLLAGLVSALFVFWVDAQINIPVPTTRLISFAVAALILLLADQITCDGAEDTDTGPAADNLRVWGIACTLLAACASFLPAGVFDPATAAQDAGRWGQRILPLLAFLFVAAWAAWRHAQRSGDLSGSVVRARLTIVLGLPSIYVAIQRISTVQPDSAPTFEHVQAIAMTSFAAPLFIIATCIAFALLVSRDGAPATGAPLISRAARWSIWVVAGSMLLVTAVNWRATRASVALNLVSKVSINQPQLREQLIEESIRLLPYERHARQQLVFDLLGRAIADIRKLKDAAQPAAETPDRIAAVVRNLNAAETAARAATRLFPGDPWVVFALANVLQVEALRVLRPLDPQGGMRAAQEANQLFARVHRMFPAEPVYLRNWAQLAADQGNVPDAYRLLDVMAELIPHDPEPYSEKITIARQVFDQKTIFETLERAHLALEPQDFSRLTAVATKQQN